MSQRKYPRNWRTLRTLILARDHGQCQIRGHNCLRIATEVDHIVGLALGGGHQPENLRAACQPCNRARPDGRTRGPNLLIE